MWVWFDLWWKYLGCRKGCCELLVFQTMWLLKVLSMSLTLLQQLLQFGQLLLHVLLFLLFVPNLTPASQFQSLEFLNTITWVHPPWVSVKGLVASYKLVRSTRKKWSTLLYYIILQINKQGTIWQEIPGGVKAAVKSERIIKNDDFPCSYSQK